MIRNPRKFLGKRLKSFTANHKIYDITDRDQHELLNIEIKYWNDLDNKDNTTHSHGGLQHCVIVIFSLQAFP